MKIIGHRGARGLAPENTALSIEKALIHNVDEIEIDVRVTKDGVAILHHDKVLVNPIAGHLKLSETNYKQLKKYKSDLITLDQAIEIVKQKVPLMLEVKPLEPAAPIVKVIKKYLEKGYKKSSFSLGSKSQITLLELHRALPEIEKVVIEPWSGVRAHHRAVEVNAKRLFMNEKWLWIGYIKAVSHRGYELYPYTLNSKPKARRWLRYGIAGVITDYPDLFERK